MSPSLRLFLGFLVSVFVVVALVLADYVTRNLSHWLTTVLP